MKISSEFNDAYYALRIITRKSISSKNEPFLVRVHLIRKDTEKPVVSTFVSGQTGEGFLRNLRQKLLPLFLTLPRPPHQWMMLSVWKLLDDCQEHHDELVRIRLKISTVLHQNISTADLEEMISDLYYSIRMQTINLVRQAEALSEEDKLALFVADELDYQSEFGDDYELAIRDEVFEFILDPSDEVKVAHQKHIERLHSGG